MHFIAILTGLYTLGFVFSYLWYRDTARNWHNGDWVLMEKIIVIALSFFSLAGLCVCSLLVILTKTDWINLDKKCKW